MHKLFKFFNNDKLVKDGIILFFGMAFIHILNLLFQVVMGRVLSTSEYALLCTLLNMLNIFIIPLGVISTTLNRTTQILVQENRQGDILRLIIKTLKITFFIGIFLSLICFIFPTNIASFLNLNRTEPVLIFGFILLGLFSRPIFDSVLLGMQNFKDWLIVSIFGWSSRLIIGSILVLNISAFAGWGLLGHGLGFYIAILISILLLYSRLNKFKKTSLDLPPLTGFIGSSFIILFGLSIIMFSDIILVKHLYPHQVDEFAYAATLGRLIIFIPQAFITSMFPKVVSDKGTSSNHFKLFTRTLLIVLIITIIGSVFFYWLVPFLMNLIYGIKSLSSNLLLWSRIFALSMVPVSLCLVCVRYVLAQKKYLLGLTIPLGAILYLCVIFEFQSGIINIIILLTLVSLAQVVIIFTFCLIEFRKIR